MENMQLTKLQFLVFEALKELEARLAEWTASDDNTPVNVHEVFAHYPEDDFEVVLTLRGKPIFTENLNADA